MKTYIFEQEDWEKVYLESVLKKNGIKVEFSEDELIFENVEKYKDAEVVVVFVYSQINKKVLAKLPKLKAVITGI